MSVCDEEQAAAWLSRLPEYDRLASQRLEQFIGLLHDENRVQNLVSASSLSEAWVRHVVDSAQLLLHVPRGTQPRRWLDLGTGAGFPGVAIAALLPETEVVLVESRARRIDWLERVKAALGLENVRIAGCRLECLEDEPFSVISARAFAPLDKLLGLAWRFSTKETVWLLPKGRSAQQELDSLRGWQHSLHTIPSQTDSTAGIIVGMVSGQKGRHK